MSLKIVENCLPGEEEPDERPKFEPVHDPAI
jgi:hypothetical protein